MAKPHRSLVVGFGLVVSLAFGPVAVCGDDQSTKRESEKPGLEREGSPESFKLPVDAKAQKTLEQAQDLIKGEDWAGAILLLQGLLDGKENPFVQLKGKSSDGQVIGSYTAAKAAANLLIGSLAPKGRQLYEKMQGAAAKKLLTQAKEKNNDPAMLADAAERYRHTEAGAEALAQLTRGRKIVPAKTAPQAEWPMFAGDPARSAQGQGSAPIMTMQWQHQSSREPQAGAWLKQAANMLENRRLPVIPAFSPITATIERDGKPLPLVIFRSFSGIHAVNCKNGKLEWESPSMWSIDAMARPERMQLVSQWINQFQGSNGSALFENSTVGTLSRDDSTVYAVDDLQLLPHPNFLMQMQFNGGIPNFGPLDEPLHTNRLQAFFLKNGKLRWELGGRGPESGELGDSYFLGPPLPLNGKLYLLIEKDGELRLVCLDPKKNIVEKEKPILWLQNLGTVREKLLLDVGRRIQAAHIAYGDDILVCPTNAGAIVAVDLITHSPLWAYSYGKAPAAEPDEQNLPVKRRGTPQARPAEWKVSAPIIQDGKVVFAAPDHDSVLCLNLRDGSRLWDAKRNDDVYLGGIYKSKVLLVGKSTCRALSLKEGQQLWKLETGLPSGRGVASDNVYYLPLKAGARSRAPEVCAIDIERGAIVGHSKRSSPDRGAEVPGNLLFFAGEVISQSTAGVTAFPQLHAVLKEIDTRLKQNPHDPSGLSQRGDLRLAKGDLNGAVEDLRAALANQPAEEMLPRIRAKLFEALTELLQRDFKAGEKYLKEFKELSEIPIPEGASLAQSVEATEERQRRQSQYFVLLGRGREMQGRLVDAFSAYLEFGSLTPGQELLTVPGETGLKVRPSTWAAGRIQAMVAKADPGQRQSLENLINQEWKAVQQAKDTNRLHKFVSTFGSFLPVRHEARLNLAERLMKGDDFLKAELYLLALSKDENPQVAGRAIEALASLMVRKGLMEDAGYYYRILSKNFSRTVIRDGKTGADLFNDLATDKRFVSLLDEPRSPWSGGGIKVREVFNSNPSFQPFCLEAEGEPLPYFQRHRLAIDSNGFLRVIDVATEEERWTQQLGNRPNAAGVFSKTQNLRLPFYHLGHLIVINTGAGVYGLDPIGRQGLWGKQLLGPEMGTPHQFMTDQDGTRQVLYADGSVQAIGRTGPIGPAFVCLQTRLGLIALDPLQGKTLWTRSDVSPRVHVFGDDRQLFVVDVDATGKVIGRGRAFRANDGASLPVADFGALYQRRLRTLGGKLLLVETAAKGDQVLRYYDVLTGKDLWKRTFTANALVLKTDDPQLAGVVEPKNESKVTVVDLGTFKEVLSSRVDPKDLDKVQEAYLLGDQDRFYLALSQPPDRQHNPWGGPWPNVTNGIHSIPVNGWVYAFDRKSNKLVWKAEVSNQMLIVNQFQNLPMLLFTARTNKIINQAGASMTIPLSTVKSIDKRTGKLLFDKEYPSEGNNFYALNVNLRAGTAELVRHNLRIEHHWER